MRYETPYVGPLEILARYDPARQIGQATAPATAACPSRPWWLIAVALAVGGMVGAGMTKRKKDRRGRIQ